ncbi:MAG: malate dehydrogenase, partial [Planctomycetota bacterium]|nr:malate dehydrogenase [Planctomycetota bacterium]
VRVLVIGNPCNTNCLIARNNAPDIPDDRWFAMTRLDHNRAVNQLAVKAGVDVSAVERVTIWGNHSATQYPDYHHALISGNPAAEVIDDEQWLQEDFISRVQKRGAEVIEARGKSSAASAASAICDHVRTFHNGTAENDWTSAAVVSDGSYGITEGLIASFPIQATSSGWEIVQGLETNEFSRARIDTSVSELEQERDVVSDLL